MHTCTCNRHTSLRPAKTVSVRMMVFDETDTFGQINLQEGHYNIHLYWQVFKQAWNYILRKVSTSRDLPYLFKLKATNSTHYNPLGKYRDTHTHTHTEMNKPFSHLDRTEVKLYGFVNGRHDVLVPSSSCDKLKLCRYKRVKADIYLIHSCRLKICQLAGQRDAIRRDADVLQTLRS